MVSTFGSLAASPLPRDTLIMAAGFKLNDAGEPTGLTAATPSDEAVRALFSFVNPATGIDP
jgi:hypothetical protein